MTTLRLPTRRLGWALILTFVVAMVGLFLGSQLTLAQTGKADTIVACVRDGVGLVKIVEKGESCPTNWTLTNWSIQGPSGPPGAKGAAGDRGPVGAEGNEGDQGPPGALKGAVFNELWYEQYRLWGIPDEGTPWFDELWTFYRDIHGIQGEGAPGPTGAVGAPGVQGAMGDRGPVGAEGAEGNQGAPGVKGAMGDRGPVGAEGAEGDQGAPGPDGAAGQTCLVGTFVSGFDLGGGIICLSP